MNDGGGKENDGEGEEEGDGADVDMMNGAVQVIEGVEDGRAAEVEREAEEDGAAEQEEEGGGGGGVEESGEVDNSAGD